MNIKHHLITVLAACCALGISSASAQNYTLTDLGVLPEKEVSIPTAINAAGYVTGTSSAGESNQSTFCYENSKTGMEDMSVIPGSISRGFGINGFDQMVGDSTFGKGRTISHAALFTKGAVLDLGTLRSAGLNSYSRANGINALGQVVGFAGSKRDGSESRAFAWTTASGMFDLGTLGGTYAQAVAINDAGFVTGNAQLPVSSVGGVEVSHAFIYQAFSITERNTKPMADLGTLGGDDSYGTFINAKNHVVGYSTVNKSDDRIHAFLHNGKTMIDLGSLSGASLKSDISFALGVNASDEVVGYSYLPSNKQPAPQQVAFIYREGLMVNLNDLVSQPGPGVLKYRLDAATAINDEGQIAVIAFDKSTGDFRAVLLTPIVKGK
jgi:probable HAF family extracellular repeat protein